MVPQKVLWGPLRPSKNLLWHHKEVRKYTLNLIFSLRPGLGWEGLTIGKLEQNVKYGQS